MIDNRTTEKYEGLIDSWKLRKLASTAQGYAECDPRLNGREILFESAEAMRKAANTIEALSVKRTCHIVKASRKYVLSDGTELYENGCSECNEYIGDKDNFCSNCGAKVVDK